MRTEPRRCSTRTLTALVAGGLLAASVGTAHADLIVNSVDDSIDIGVEQMDLVLGASGATTIFVDPKDDDTDPGCNFDGASETVTVNLVSDKPEVATVAPATLVLSACGAAGAQPVTVTPVGVGTATITTTVAPRTNSTGGTFSIANARFSAKVSERANTAPKLEIVGVSEGQKVAKGPFERPECVATDPDDFPAPSHTKRWLAPLTELTGPYAVDGLGTRAAMCSYTDGYGVQVLARTTYSIVDDTPPVIQRTLAPELPESGWFRGDVMLTHKIFENQSPSSFPTPPDCDVTVTEDIRLRTVTCSATSAGGTSTVTTNIRRDATAPVVSPTATVVSGTLGKNGWYTSPVEVAFSATDATSLFMVDGRQVGTSTQTVTTEDDGELVVKSPAFTDRAGNASAVGAVTLPVKVDTTAPAAPTASVTPTDAEGSWTSQDVVVSFTGSGDDTCTPDVTVDAETAREGQVVAGTCTDEAGNVSAEKEVTVYIDRTGPTVSEATAPAPTGDNGWYTSDVDVTFTATDALSGVETDSDTVTTEGEGEAVEVLSPSFTDKAGNTVERGAVTATYKVDKTAPNAPTATLSREPNADGWSNEDVVVSFTDNGDNDGGSGGVTCTDPVTVSDETKEVTVRGTCTDAAGNESAAEEVTVELDKTAPAVTADAPAPNGDNGWYTSDVAASFTATDARSGLESDSATVTTTGEGLAVEVESPAFTDRAGNTAAAGAVTASYPVDKTAPAVPTFTGGLAGYLYAFDDKPAVPGCTSSDATSGLASCVVTGDGSAVGLHTYTATATDKAGNTSTATRRYVVAPWISLGYASPVEMRELNTVKAGSTLALKFEVFAGLKELKDPSKVSMSSKPVTCPSGLKQNEVSKAVTTGSTSLRYDTATGKFVYSWKTPTGAGTCHALTMKTADGSSTTTTFRLK